MATFITKILGWFKRKDKSVFTNVHINLTGPICSCKEQNLSWSLPFDAQMRSTMRIACDSCQTFLVVSHEKLVASFRLDNPYPDGTAKKKKKEEDATVLKFVPGGKQEEKEKN